MKTKLLFTATFLLTSFFISAQAVITTIEDAETFDLPAISGVVATGDVGAWSDKGTYFQLRSGTLIEDISGDITFAVATASGSVDGTLGFQFKKYRGTKLDITVSVAGYTDESFSFPAEADDVTLNEIHNIEFAQKVTFTDAPLTITFDIVDLDQVNYTGKVLTQAFNVTIDKSVPLSTDDFTKSTFAIYPNPVTNSFQLNSTKTIESVQLYNVTGRLLKTFNAKTNYDISDLATGIYIANIKTQSGSKALRIVKK